MPTLYHETDCPVAKAGCGDAFPFRRDDEPQDFLPVCILECILPKGRAGWL